jgi:hypothetical protein
MQSTHWYFAFIRVIRAIRGSMLFFFVALWFMLSLLNG